MAVRIKMLGIASFLIKPVKKKEGEDIRKNTHTYKAAYNVPLNYSGNVFRQILLVPEE